MTYRKPHVLWSIACCSALSLAACARSQKPMAEPDAAVTLRDGTAGKACKHDADCGNGQCVGTLQITSATASEVAPGGYCTVGCTGDLQCGHGGECSVPAGEAEGLCLASCVSDTDCRDGYLCVGTGSRAGVAVSGVCRPKPPTDHVTDGSIGRPCTSDEACHGGECASTSPLGSAYPGNYCTARCLDDAACGEGAACLLVPGSSDAGHCYESCKSDGDCSRDGYRCWQLAPNFQACYPASKPLPDNTAGKPCSTDQDCGGNRQACATSLPFGSFSTYQTVPAPDGYCTQVCSLDSECGDGGECISHGDQGGMCLGRCTSTSDCRDGYVCVDAGRSPHMPDRVCAPITDSNPLPP